MLSGRKFRVWFTPEQEYKAGEFGDACRYVWNVGLEQRREYRRRRASIGYVQQARELAAAKPENPWLKAAPGHALQQTLMDLDRACLRCGPFAVQWRSTRRWMPSFRFPEGRKIAVERLSRRWGRAKLPKLGWVKFRMSRALGGPVRSATISRSGNYWYIAFLVEDGTCTPERHSRPGTAIGLDRGVVTAVACSDGVMFNRAFTRSGEGRRYRRLEQRLARQRKGSGNRMRTLASMRAVRGRERARRADFVAKTAGALVTKNALVVLEDLRIRNMTQSARGSLAAPGAKVAQKAGLNRAILGKGWNQLEVALISAARYTGSRVLKVPAAHTSQKCSRCGYVDSKSRESQARFRCTRCRYTVNADVNAALNVLAAGRAVTACGDLGVARSVKQEPLALTG
ncbi:RNA-guided endonuclease InsQ/TnpB family protein [Nocardia sp. CA-145437]|uniref:RNA-guided endonuclease InsQ/TnpB family protein n=1 Tax=Nocardia sp. CA-145437 TaxID=3239980 RepID=UPI003D97F898